MKGFYVIDGRVRGDLWWPPASLQTPQAAQPAPQPRTHTPGLWVEYKTGPATQKTTTKRRPNQPVARQAAPQKAPEPPVRASYDALGYVPVWNGRLVQTAVLTTDVKPKPATMTALGGILATIWRRPQVLLDQLGIPVHEVPMGYLDGPGRRVFARTVLPPFGPLIQVVSLSHEDEERALAHEAAHWLFNLDGTGESERLADAFAAGWMEAK